MNAAAHGEHVEVAAHATPAGGVEITVDDDGPGIPPERFEDAFTPFGRLDEARNQNEKGVGLGLAIARGRRPRPRRRSHPRPLTAGRPARGGAAAGLGWDTHFLLIRSQPGVSPGCLRIPTEPWPRPVRPPNALCAWVAGTDARR